jgi:predicted PurR-regulated permease PerM
MDRLRRDTRREVAGTDDEQGAVADAPPPPAEAAEEATPAPPTAPPRPVTIPHGIAIATAWAWRFLLVAAAVGLGFWLLQYFSPVTVPLAIAVLITALATPLVDLLDRAMPRSLATAVVVIGGLAAVAGMLALVGTQVAAQFSDLRVQVVEGLRQIQGWLQRGPLHLSDSDITQLIDRGRDAVGASANGEVVSQVTEVGTTVSHAAAGFFIVVFSTYFFLYEGNRIWGFLVGLFPRAARGQVDASGRTAWVSLTAFVRATVLVALVDALGIGLAAAALGVPLALAIGVLVFLGAFVPLVGALVSGIVAVLVALVAQGFYVALAMLGAVVLVQQIESHILQPFLLGRLVSLHPLAVIVGLAAGIIVGGIVGALVAVPLLAAGNAVVKYLAGDVQEPPPRRPVRLPRTRPRPA